MSDRRFLVSLREVLNSERILLKRILVSGKKILTVMLKNLLITLMICLMMLERLLQPYRAMLPKGSLNEAPATYVSKPWHYKKLTLKTIPI